MPLPVKRDSRGWLNHLVPALVNKLNRNKPQKAQAFVTYSSLSEPLDLVESDFEAENWEEVLRSIEASPDIKSSCGDMNGLLIVSPLMGKSQACPNGKNPVVLERALTGSLGDCCEDEEDLIEEAEFSSVGNDRMPWHKYDTIENSYGVVLQSTTPNHDIDGCYILNTSTSQSVGCSCTQYSMSRALCNNDGSCLSVRSQIDSAWLVNPFTQ